MAGVQFHLAQSSTQLSDNFVAYVVNRVRGASERDSVRRQHMAGVSVGHTGADDNCLVVGNRQKAEKYK
jgi:hypothetical protein